MRLSDTELEQLLSGPESYRTERKESLRGDTLEELGKVVCAFANDLAGGGEPGVIFVGVTDRALGPSGFVPDDAALLKLTGLKADGRIVPPPAMLVERRTVLGLDLAVVTVQPSTAPPVRFKGAIWVRNGPSGSRASLQEETILNERRRSKDGPFDTRPLPGLGLEALSLATFQEVYLPKAFAPEVLAENGRSVEQQLAATRMVDSATAPTATALGVLVLGRAPQEHLPGAYIQFLRIAGTELGDPIVDQLAIDGTVQAMLGRCDDKLAAHNFEAVRFSDVEIETRTSTYPLDALRQLVRNAVMHRTYEETHAPVRVTWFDDRIEILSPGGPYGLVSKAAFGQPGVTDYRNPGLADALRVLGFVQRFGVGIATARKALEAAGHPPLMFEVDDRWVRAIVRAKGAVA
jgi:ATP-dependent DNA helicase RecG